MHSPAAYTPDTPLPRLTVVIPALNEEAAIGGTIARCKEAVGDIVKTGGVRSVELIVVSDGSTDRTAELAREFDGVSVYEFPKNRGYGAAIKYGFHRGSGELVGFLDADGTCDPEFFADLCREVTIGKADIALGSRLSAHSRMPAIRTFGNRLYALLLSWMANRPVSDTASGMRVLWRSALADLGPLPDGLHFTPAMSARAVIRGLRVTEVPMSYEERIGDSKLRVTRDGWRFLQAIVDGLLLFRPERLFWTLSTVLLLAASLLSVYPIEFYFTHRRVEEWMIYRFVVAFLLGGAGGLALGAGSLISFMSEIVLGSERRTFLSTLSHRLLRGLPAMSLVLGIVAGSTLLVWPGVVEYVSTRHVSLHWSRVIVAAFGFLSAFQIALTALLLRITSLWLDFAVDRSTGQPDRSQPVREDP